MLSRTYRLKKNYQFGYIYKKGASASSKLLVLVYAKRRAGIGIGFSVSNKIGKAVVRNKVKRRLRHAARELLGEFAKGYGYVFVARPDIKDVAYSEIARTMSNLIKKVR